MRIVTFLTLAITSTFAIRVPIDYNSESTEDTKANFSDTSIDTGSPRQAGYGLIKFEGQQNHDQNQGFVTFQGQTAISQNSQNDFSSQDNRFSFPPDDDPANNYINYPQNNEIDLAHKPGVVFQDNNNVDSQSQIPLKQKKRKRRRRRKPKQYVPGQSPGFGPIPGGYPVGGNPTGPGYPGQFQYPHRRPQSAASQALTAVTDALTSLALYDDYQCVPRLLCEAASGGALATAGSSPILQSIANLQPLLTLLAAYNGASTSPLFVFGRAVFLGMTSKNNPGTCRYAYSQCPNDPEELVHYLNNHNGGFFRFFSAPQFSNPQLGQQNLEQFYNQLAGPGQYGLLGNIPNQLGPSSAYGLQQNVPGQNYGTYPPYPVGPNLAEYPQQGFPGQYPGQPQSYGLFPNNPYIGVQQPNLYNINQQYYGNGYRGKYRLYEYRDLHQNNGTGLQKAQKRIQNVKIGSQEAIENLDYDDTHTNWKFPDSTGHQLFNSGKREIRGGRQLNFPEKIKTNNVHEASIAFKFPEAQSNRQYYDSYIPLTSIFYNNDQDNGSNVKTNHNVNHSDGTVGDGFEIIYIVRGDGDPSHPEIVRVRNGEKVF